jgi:hypothetical protein
MTSLVPTEEVLVRTSCHEPGASSDAVMDDRVDPVAGGLVDQRSVRKIASGRVTDLEFRCPLRGESCVLLDHRSSDEVPAGRHADLTGVVEKP